MRKHYGMLILIIALLIIGTSIGSSADSSTCELKLEQYHANMPMIDLFFYPTDFSGAPILDFVFDASEVEAYLDDQLLDVDVFECQDFVTTYVVVLDISGSVGKKYFENAKEALQRLVNKLDNNKLMLLTMGEDIITRLDGSESIEDAHTIISGLELGTSNEKTNYYEGLNKAIDLAEKMSGDRSVVVTISDGLNTKESSYNRQDTLERMKNAKLSMHAIGIGRKDNAVALDDLKRFAEATNGFYTCIQAEDKESIDLVEAAYNRCFDIICSCKAIRLIAESNAVNGSILQIKISNSYGVNTLTIKDFSVDSWQVDKDAPYIVSIYVISPREIRIRFSEQMLYADQASNYSIKDENNLAIEISGVIYDSSTFSATISFASDLYDGNYSVLCFNLTDSSKQKNLLSTSDNTVFEQTGNPRPIENKSEGLAWLICIPVLLVLLLAMMVILIILKTHKKDDSNKNDNFGQQNDIIQDCIGRESVVLNKIDGHNIVLSIVERSGLCRTVPMFIANSCIFGRSQSECDVCIDDSRMSRQHFAICCYGDTTLTIEDLNSTNGTVLNGVPLTDIRPLRVGDTIMAGNTKIIVEE